MKITLEDIYEYFMNTEVGCEQDTLNFIDQVNIQGFSDNILEN